MQHGVVKSLSFVMLSLISKMKNLLRLPHVDFIGLKPIFVIKIKHSSGQKSGVAENTHLSCRNNVTCRPDSWRELRA